MISSACRTNQQAATLFPRAWQSIRVLRAPGADRPVRDGFGVGENAVVPTIPALLPPGLRSRLAEVVGPSHLLTDPDTVAGHAVDWTGRFRGRAAGVVRPGSTAEVAAVLAACSDAGVPVVPQGGNTGLVGGSVPRRGEVVLSLRRLAGGEAVDRLAGQVTAGAGVTLADLDAHAGGEGLAFGVDLSARESATVGGMVATNAGGLRMLRYGAMRAQVRGIEAVLADGRVLAHLSGLEKDNTGYDLPGLLTGSEGTLAVVTRVRLRLVPRLPERAVALMAFDSTEAALEAAAELRRCLPSLEAAEVFFADGLELVCTHLGLLPPFGGPAPVYVLVEVAALEDPTPALAEAVGALAVEPADAAVATEPAARARLWRYREGHTEAINTAGVPVKLDVALPGRALPGFVPRVREVVEGAAPGARSVLFGHAADGNLHVNVLGAGDRAAAVEDAVLRLVADLGGSISAEHGIGVAKRAWLHLNRSPEELAVFRALKQALDPGGILNPGVLLPDEA
jgi:FAD/FMN-containing dehydrogenase